MAIDIDQLNANMPDVITLKLTNRVVRKQITIPLSKWSEWTVEEKLAYVTEWATEILRNAATVTSEIGYSPKAERPHIEPRPIRDNPQA